MLAHMRDDIFRHNDWCLTDTERTHTIDAVDSGPPKAANVVGEFGVSLAAALSFALFVCGCLSAAGIPAP